MPLKKWVALSLAATVSVTNICPAFAEIKGDSPKKAAFQEIYDKSDIVSYVEDEVSVTYAEEQPGIGEDTDLEVYSTSNVKDTDYKYKVEGGYIYFDESTGTVTGCDETVTSADIPDEINGIKVTFIGDYAFKYCSGLTSITISEGVTSIGIYAFHCCSDLTSITIPESVTSIADCSFSLCSGLKTAGPIGGGYDYEFGWKTAIPDNAFWGCSGLTSITIPESVTTIGDSAFLWCDSLTSITIPGSVTSIGDGVFSSCSSLTSITIPERVTSIGEYAFSGCSSLTGITIPESVTSIGFSAFYKCSGLTSITIPEGVTSIGNGVFLWCDSLTSITIPESVTTIGDSAFSWCDSLTSITIPEGVTSIGEAAFRGCSSLTRITIPGSVTTVGDYAFCNCSNLTSITIPGSVTTIGDYAFYNCISLTSIMISDNVGVIQGNAFNDCDKDKLCFYVYEDSYADKWAKENGFKTSYEIPDGIFAYLEPGMGVSLDRLNVGSSVTYEVKSKIKYSSSPLVLNWSLSDHSAATLIPELTVTKDSEYYYYRARLTAKAEGKVAVSVAIPDRQRLTFPTVNIADGCLKIEKITVNGLSHTGKNVSKAFRYETVGTNTVNVRILFNACVDVPENSEIDICISINNKEYVISTVYPMLYEKGKDDEIEFTITDPLPKGKAYIKFKENSVMPLSSDIVFNPEDFKDVYIENTADFIYNLDNFRFRNTSGTAGDNSYPLSNEAINKLRENGLSANTVNKEIRKKWAGVCYGMTNFIAMAKRGTVDLADFPRGALVEEYKGNFVNSLERPTASDSLRDNLNYLFITQHCRGLSNGVGFFEQNNKTIKENLKKLAGTDNRIFENFGITLNIAYKKGLLETVGKHSILPYRMEKSENGYSLYCYDPNYLTPTIISFDSAYENLSIKNDGEEYYGEIKGIGFDYVNIVEGLYGNGLETMSYDLMETGSDTLKIYALLDGDFEISNGVNTVYYSRGDFSGDTDIVISSALYGGGGFDSAAEILLELPAGDYTVKSANNGLDCTFDNGKTFACVNSSGSAHISFKDNNVTVEGSNTNVKALMSFDGTGEKSVFVETDHVNKVVYSADENNSLSIDTDTVSLSKITKIDDCKDTDEIVIDGNASVDYSGDKLDVKKQDSSTTESTETTTEESTESTSESTTENTTESTTRKLEAADAGDVDGSGVLTSRDVSLILYCVLNKDSGLITEEKLKLADVDEDGAMTANDASYLLDRIIKGEW